MSYEEISFQIILHAGDSKSLYLEAMDLIEIGEYEKAEQKATEAENKLLTAHESHTKLLTDLASGKDVSCNILLTHALDHMMSAENAQLVYERLVHVYKVLDSIKK